MRFLSALTIFFTLSLPFAQAADLPPVEVVPHVDLNRYMGKWYEIASFPQRFQKDCVATTATYTLRGDGKVDVLNECRKKSFDGEYDSAKGLAWVVDKETNAKLKVRFQWPFTGDYWIIDLDENYEYVVVGHPERTYLWILSRTPKMDEATFESLTERAKKQGFDLSKLNRTPQP